MASINDIPPGGQPTTVEEVDHEGRRVKTKGKWVPMETCAKLAVEEEGVLYGFMAGPTEEDGSGWVVGQYRMPHEDTASAMEKIMKGTLQ